jgi:zinc transporter ZupT
MKSEDLFRLVIPWIFGLLMLYGVGMILTLLFAHESVARAVVAGFVTMFTGVVGMISGFLIGSRRNGNGG